MSIDDSLLNLNTTEQNKSLEKNNVNRKKNLTDYFTRSNDTKKKMITKMVQVNLGICMSDDDISAELPSEKFWNSVAEKKRIELENALAENERLHKIKEALIAQNLLYKEMLEENKTFIDVFKELVQDKADDTGIDVTDLNESSNICV